MLFLVCVIASRVTLILLSPPTSVNLIAGRVHLILSHVATMKSSAVAQQTDSSPALGEANGRQELKIDAVAASPAVVAVTGQQHPPRRRRSASTGSTLGSGTTAGGKRPSTKSTTPSVASAGSVQAVRRSSSSAAQSNNSNRKKSAAGSSSSSSLATNGDTSAGGLLRNKLKQQERRSSKASVQSQLGNVGQQPIKKKTNQAGTPLEKPAALSKQLRYNLPFDFRAHIL